MGYFLVILLLAVSVLPNFSKADPEVTTKSGRLRGKTVNIQSRNLDAYLSIPYAKPPVGDLRFKRPESVVPWTGVKDATKMSPACLQYTPSQYPWYFDQPKNQSEDCLYLNIWIPSSVPKKRAVLFWIHGGGFTLGSSRDPLYDGRSLAVNGDVIVVTINYRLGALGFLSSGTSEAPGNAGLYDIAMALKWVNENIEAFNGDKNRITIFGESAGAVSVNYLTLFRLADGLYKRAILQSGSALIMPDGAQGNFELGQQVAKVLRCADDQKTLRNSPNEVVDCLRHRSATSIVRTTGDLRPLSSVSFLPVFGDAIVGNNPIISMDQLKYSNVDVLIGCVADEGSLFVSTDNPDVFGFFGEKVAFVNKTAAKTLLRKFMSRVSPDDRIFNYYFGNLREDDWGEIQKKLYQAAGDLLITCPTVYAAENYAKKNNVYFYSFEQRPSITPWAPNQGVAHYEEMQYIFGKPTIFQSKYSTREIFFSKRMMQIWADFAKTGNPETNWPLYSRNQPSVRVLKASPSRKDIQSPYVKNCDFLRSYFK